MGLLHIKPGKYNEKEDTRLLFSTAAGAVLVIIYSYIPSIILSGAPYNLKKAFLVLDVRIPKPALAASVDSHAYEWDCACANAGSEPFGRFFIVEIALKWQIGPKIRPCNETRQCPRHLTSQAGLLLVEVPRFCGCEHVEDVGRDHRDEKEVPKRQF